MPIWDIEYTHIEQWYAIRLQTFQILHEEYENMAQVLLSGSFADKWPN